MMGKLLEELMEWLNSPEGKKEFEEESKKMQFITDINNKYIEKLHNITVEERSVIIDKIIKKYDSDEYYEREMYKLGYQPRCSLFWLLDEYAEKYGENLPDEDDNPFSHHRRIIDGKYIIKVTCGQGCIIQVVKVS